MNVGNLSPSDIPTSLPFPGNGSDVFGSDICTCKPYLVFAIEECIRTAQRGGVGVVVYFRKEGRALGEVTKYLVYNLRKRGGDSADKYFRATEMIAGVKDMRFQALMPDVLHWLGIKKINNMVSMSDMCAPMSFSAIMLTRVYSAQEIRGYCTIGYSNSQALRHPWCVVWPISCL